jgi:hypothetical protein
MVNMGNMVNCHIINEAGKDGIWIHRPKLLKTFKETFKNILGGTKRKYMTPSAPKTHIICLEECDPLITPETKKQFKMGVGMLLHFVKNSRPDISNSL